MNSSIIIRFLMFCLVFIVCFNIYEVEMVKVSDIIENYASQFQCDGLMLVDDYCNSMEMEVNEIESTGYVKQYQRIFKIKGQSDGCSTSSGRSSIDILKSAIFGCLKRKGQSDGCSTIDILKTTILDYKPFDQFNDHILSLAKRNCKDDIMDTFYKIKYNSSKQDICKIIIKDIYFDLKSKDISMENIEIEVNNNIHNTCIKEIQNFISQVDNLINHPIEDIAKYIPNFKKINDILNKPSNDEDDNDDESVTYYDVGYIRHALRVFKGENKSYNKKVITKWCREAYHDIEK